MTSLAVLRQENEKRRFRRQARDSVPPAPADLDVERLTADLNRHVRGEVRFDKGSRPAFTDQAMLASQIYFAPVYSMSVSLSGTPEAAKAVKRVQIHGVGVSLVADAFVAVSMSTDWRKRQLVCSVQGVRGSGLRSPTQTQGSLRCMQQQDSTSSPRETALWRGYGRLSTSPYLLSR
jgi:hypothetical protein